MIVTWKYNKRASTSMSHRSRGGDRGQGVRKSQVAIGFLRNTGMDPPEEAIGPLGSLPHGAWVGL